MPEVVLLKLNAASGQRDRLAFKDAAWLLLQELGETFGWKPLGARYQSRSRQEADQTRHNYEPGASDDLKYVDVEDAREWASALRMAKASAHLQTLVGRRFDEAKDAEFAAVLSEFIDYASAGGFSFSRGSGA